MQVLKVKDVILKEYEKFTARVEKYELDFNIDSMSNLELAGNLFNEYEGDIDKISEYIKGVNKETSNKYKFRLFTILNICKAAEQSAAELFEHPCSMPGTLISKICMQNKGYPIADEIFEKYFDKEKTSQHPAKLSCYYSIEYNQRDNIHYLSRDLDKSPRKPYNEEAEEAAPSISIHSEDKADEEKSNSNSETEDSGNEGN